jgi:hypothetical protein
VKLASHVVSRERGPKSGMPLLTEQLVTNRSYFEACVGQYEFIFMTQNRTLES